MPTLDTYMAQGGQAKAEGESKHFDMCSENCHRA